MSWPKGKWLVSYGGRGGTFATLAKAKKYVAALITTIRVRGRIMSSALPKNAVISRVGYARAYHGTLEDLYTGKMKWKAIR